MRQVIAILIFILSLCAVTSTYAKPGTVVNVVDGDTIKIITDTGMTTVRLYGVDCPEKKQAFGIKAKTFTTDLVKGKVVDVSTINTDRYGRTVAIVTVDNKTLQEQLVVTGHAWVYPQYCKKKFCPAWQTLQKISADNKWGLWADPMPVQPWVWRKQKR